MFILHGPAACPRWMSVLPVQASSSCFFMLHVRATCTCCMYAVFPCCTSLLYCYKSVLQAYVFKM
jgi:hypothetical protein